MHCKCEAMAILLQERQTTLHRFVVEGTVEEAIHRLRESEQQTAPVGETPTKRAKRVEEAKSLTWDQLRSLFCEGGEHPLASPVEIVQL